MIKRLILFSILYTTAQWCFAQGQSPIPLYNGKVPNSKTAPAAYAEMAKKDWVSQVTVPTITPYIAEHGNGSAIIVFPGGGYSGLAIDHEGADIALEFNKIGISAFVVKYRLPSDDIMVDKTIGPLQDAQRAIQLVRQHASEWKLNPDKIGIIGFSAGGHLASTLGTHFNKAVIDNAANINLRPDFMMLIYPVISFGAMAHAGSRENLIGKNSPQALIDLYSNEKQVTTSTPPTLLVHAEDDDVVPVQNSLIFYDALLKNKVKSEMHIYQAGGHGFGLNNPKSTEKWFEACKPWLAQNGF